MVSNSNDGDREVDNLLFSYVNPKAPKSFFLFAGAGSGKTRSLVTLLNRIKESYGENYSISNKRVAVITYTNAAADEITYRLGDSSIFSISTIHSFIWNLIQYYQTDIKIYMESDLLSKIDEIDEKKSASKKKKKQKYYDQLERLKGVAHFTYNPNGNNLESNSLNHQDVINIGAHFLMNKSLLQKILVQKYPILLIDESQDTNKGLIEAIFKVQSIYKNDFVLGLFGDVKQRIYLDGQPNLGENLPEDWGKPVKEVNYRSAKRIIELANKISENTRDIHQQKPRTDAIEGFVRLFIINRNKQHDSKCVEKKVVDIMKSVTGDDDWIYTNQHIEGEVPVKKLILEHHMAASRLGFLPLFESLYKCNETKNGVLDGTIPELKIFIDLIIPIYRVSQLSNGKFEITSIVRKESPLLDKEILMESENEYEQLKKASCAVKALCKLWENKVPSFYELIKCVYDHSLFKLPESLNELCREESISDENIWMSLKDVTLSQIIAYSDYISNNSEFGTHQGVKGLEYDRVLVIIDDSEAKGFLFKYNKLFGIEEKSKTDIKNELEGKETCIERTNRLFYVTCTRAKKSLAIVAYTDKPSELQKSVLANGWFRENEISLL